MCIPRIFSYYPLSVLFCCACCAKRLRQQQQQQQQQLLVLLSSFLCPRMEHQNENEDPKKQEQEPISRNTSCSHQNTTTLSSGSHLTRAELLKRRFNNLNRLSKCYRGLYWALIDRLKTLYRNYLWDSALSPFNNDDNCSSRSHCALPGCEFNAMPLTTFCHFHILSDPNQKLYKPCNYVIKSAQVGPITCGKPILRSIVPSLCTVHFQKAQKHLTRTLKRTGLNVSSTTKMPPPKFHVILTEYVHHIQVKRRKERKGNKSTTVVQNEK